MWKREGVPVGVLIIQLYTFLHDKMGCSLMDFLKKETITVILADLVSNVRR